MSSKHKHSAEWHMKRAWRCVHEITFLPGSEGKRFLLLKRKAAKHLAKAKQLDPNIKIQVEALPTKIPNKIIPPPSSLGGPASVLRPGPPIDGGGELPEK